MHPIYSDIEKEKKLGIIKRAMLDFYEYNEYLKKLCEYNIRTILEKYYKGEELKLIQKIDDEIKVNDK